MRVFFNPEENFLLSTNLKVMYGTLCRQNSLVFVPNKALPLFLARRRFIHGKLRKYLLVRNPYDKIVSFFTHKFVLNKFSDANASSTNNEIQKCQQIFFPHLNLSTKDRKGTIGNRLANISFETFIEILPDVYKLDSHLWPQYWAFFLRYKTYPLLRLQYDQVIRIEENLEFLRENLRINISIRENKTDHASYEDFFSPKSYEIIHELYQKDFLEFGYEITR